MIGRKNAGVFIAFIMSAGLIASSLTAVFVAGFYNRRQFQMISSVSSAITVSYTHLDVYKRQAERTQSQVVQVIGKKIVLYKQAKDEKKRKIVLPK